MFTLCGFVAALSGGCQSADPRTQVMLVIDADDEVRARATELVIEFESRSEFDHIDGSYSQAFPTTDAEPSWPFSVALVPRGNDARRSYRITATLYEGETAIAELRARSGFVAQRTLELRLFFSGACLDEKSLSCSDQETCYDGECWSSDIDPHSLPMLGGEAAAPAADGGIPNSSVRTGAQGRADGGTKGDGGSSSGRRNEGGSSGADAADGGMTPAEIERIMGGNCGDGVWNDEEECDTAIPQGMPGACPVPESCVTGGCNPEQLEGTACKTRCVAYPVQSAIPGDDCCLPGTDPNIDPDCATVATCGNGIVEMGELCDGDCPTDPASCERANDCQRPMIVGDAASCSATCVMVEVDVCMTGDGCCGSGCSNADDAECSPSCGNGVVEDALGELCEPTSPDRPCVPCDDGDPCTQDVTTGSPENCNVRCDYVPITRTANGDGCCPAGRGNANNDNDCSPMCGNRIIERGEFCDGVCPTSAAQCEDFIACTRNGLAPSACGMRCNFEPILTAANGDSCCPFGANANIDNDCSPSCGNLVVEPGEMCDGNCPTSCPPDTDNNACTANMVVGTGCQRRCESRPVPGGTLQMCGTQCVNIQNSLTHCGACNRACASGQMCVNGMCQAQPPQCQNGTVLCGGGCVTLGTDTHCARCNDACTEAQTCSNGTCVARSPTCSAPNAMCGTQCVPLGTNMHCAACNDTCDDPETCMNGSCRRPEPQCQAPNMMLCGTECVALGTNAHCGSCTDRCDAPETCMNGRCQPPASECGNGTKEAGEDCDGSDCPSCDDNDVCTDDLRIDLPDACHPQCRHTDIPPRLSGRDGCCPSGHYSDSDSDCPPPPAVCGNGMIEPPEQCDDESATCQNCRIVTPPNPEPEPDPTPPNP